MGLPVIPNLTSASAAHPITSLDGQNGGTGAFIVGGSGHLAATSPQGLNSAGAALNQDDPALLLGIGLAVFLLMKLGRK